MEKVAVQSTTAVISLKWGNIEQKLAIGCLYKVIYEVLICAKMYDLE